MEETIYKVNLIFDKLSSANISPTSNYSIPEFWMHRAIKGDEKSKKNLFNFISVHFGIKEDILNGDFNAKYKTNENKQYKTNRNMNRKLIRLTESDIHRIVKESVKGVLREEEYEIDNNNIENRWKEYERLVDQIRNATHELYMTTSSQDVNTPSFNETEGRLHKFADSVLYVLEQFDFVDHGFDPTEYITR